MYVLGWALLVAVSLALSLGAFAWALRTGQFADQGRARFLALERPSEPARPGPSRRPPEAWALAAVGVLVALGLCGPVALWLLRQGG